MYKKKQKIPKGKHYMTVHFYARSYRRYFFTKQEALRAIEARALISKAQCYTELWEMYDEDSGAQLMLFENDNVILVPK